MRRNLPIVLAFFLGLCIATCNAFGQGISDVIEAAEAATPGPSHLEGRPNTAPASGDLQRLTERVNALEARIYMIAAKVDKAVAATSADSITPQQLERLERLENIMAELKAAKEPTLAPPEGERSVIKTILPSTVQPTTTRAVWRPATSSVRYSYPVQRATRYYEPVYYDASYGSAGGTYSGGSVGGAGSAGGTWSGYSSSYYPSSGYSSRAVQCYDQYGNPVACN